MYRGKYTLFYKSCLSTLIVGSSASNLLLIRLFNEYLSEKMKIVPILLHTFLLKKFSLEPGFLVLTKWSNYPPKIGSK